MGRWLDIQCSSCQSPSLDAHEPAKERPEHKHDSSCMTPVVRQSGKPMSMARFFMKRACAFVLLCPVLYFCPHFKAPETWFPLPPLPAQCTHPRRHEQKRVLS